MGQRRVVVVAAWLTLIVAALAAFAALSTGTARLVWLALLVFLLAVSVVGLLYELALHRLVRDQLDAIGRHRARNRRRKVESDWRATTTKSLSGHGLYLRLVPPGPDRLKESKDRKEAGVRYTASVIVTNETGAFTADAQWHQLYGLVVPFPNGLSAPDGRKCPATGHHRISWTSPHFEGERTLDLAL